MTIKDLKLVPRDPRTGNYVLWQGQPKCKVCGVPLVRGAESVWCVNCEGNFGMLETLKRIAEECRLHAEGPHDKTGNMLSILAWAEKALGYWND